MPTSNPLTDGQAGDDGKAAVIPVALPPTLPAGGRELYDQIMGGIEPELTSAQLPLLTDRYKDETPEARSARAARFKKAFAEYQKQFNEYTVKWEEQMRHYAHALQTGVEEGEKASDDDTIQGLDDAISSAA